MRLAVSPSRVIHETIDGETIVIQMGSGTYYSLVGASATVWELIEQQATVEAIVDALARRHDAARRDIEVAVTQLVDELRLEDLVAPAAGPAPELQATTSAEVTSSAPRRPLPALRVEKYTDMQDLVRLDPVHEVGEASSSQRSGAAKG
jgi:hypothetical protein